VEFAVVAPVFLALVFGMIEFGRVVMVQQLLTNATREGARKGVLRDSTDTDVKATVVNYLQSASISITTGDVTVAGMTSGDTVTVSVTVPFNQVSWLSTPIFLNGHNLNASASMRRETTD
jgi:Flp pilus assembly protein TadG